MADTGDVSIGMFIRYNGELCQILEWQHRTPGNLRAFYQGKMRVIKNGKLVENRFRSGESVEITSVEYRMLQYLYLDGESLVLMDKDTYDQIYVQSDLLGDSIKFLKESMDVKVSFENEVPILAELPNFIEVTVTYTEPGLKGDTATNTLKAATVDTGAEIRVPLFINEGDKVKIDTRTGAYMERVKG